ncbi:MAG: FeoB small GTPase domain-containing protein, partial [Ignavibacteria bacterium]|nr:FeoB small GTPase domain-containing protein [Ignavibacteria bacterium]
MRNDSQILVDKKISKNTLPKIDSTSPKVVLVGNPNVGKSCVFNYLSGMYVDVSNFPGTTVSLTKCVYDGKEIYDTPGIYGVSSFNEEERVARDIIFKSDIVINVINALNLERDLFLTLQLIDMGKKVVVLLNFNDELKKHKIKIETQKFSDLLGVEVIPTSAVSNEGLDKIKSAINNARIGIKQESVENLIATLMPYSIPRDEAPLILEGDEEVAKKNNVAPGTSHEREILYIGRRVRVNEIVDQVQHEDSKRGELVNLLGRITLSPFTGIPFLLGILFIVYLFVGDLVSQRVVDFTENTVGVGIFEYNVKSFVANYTSTEISVSIEDENEDVIEEKVFLFPAGMEKDPTLKKSFD